MGLKVCDRWLSYYYVCHLELRCPERNVIGFQIENRRDCCRERLVGTEVFLVDNHSGAQMYCGQIGLEGKFLDVDFMFKGACAGPVTGKTLKLMGWFGANVYEHTFFYNIFNFNEVRLSYQQV